LKINKKNVLLAIGLLTICAVINVLHKIDGALMAYELAWGSRILIIAIFSWFSFQKKIFNMVDFHCHDCRRGIWS
jgi:hypothetical protein